MSRLSAAQLLSLQKIQPSLRLPPELEARVAATASVKRERNLGGEMTRVVTVLTQPSGAGGVKRAGKLTDMGAYGKFGKVIKAARSVGAKADGKALREASTTARTWMAGDAGKIEDAGRDAITSRKRAAAAWIAEEAELDLELANVNSLSLDASAAAIAAKLQARIKQVEVHKILANGGKAAPPSGKGESDSFFIKDPAGNPLYIFKPIEGENDPVQADGERLWTKGGGAAREIAISKFNDDMRTMLDIDFGVASTVAVTLDSDTFRQGTKSKAITRTGALQAAIIVNGGSPLDWSDAIHNDAPETLKEIRDYKASIKTDDIQRLAVLDFLTLNLDRTGVEHSCASQQGRGHAQSRADRRGEHAALTQSVELRGSCVSVTLPAESERLQAGNFITQLPKSTEPFSADMLRKLQGLDPRAVAGSMRSAAGSLDGDLAGKIEEPALMLMEASAKFLKTAAGLAPALSPYELAFMYANRFTDYQRAALKPLASERQEVRDAALAGIVTTAAAAARTALATHRLDAEYKELGGTPKLRKLGFDESAPLPERAAHLCAGTENPVAAATRTALLGTLKTTLELIAPRMSSGFATSGVLEQIRELQDEVDAQSVDSDTLARWHAEMTSRGVEGMRPLEGMNQAAKAAFIRNYRQLDELGGMRRYDAFVKQGLIKHVAKLPLLAKIIKDVKTAAAAPAPR